jgi:two-component system cell cycle sensor histidine kinase/response regulator CckA
VKTPPPSGRPRILVVDDEIGPRESLRILLKNQFDVVTLDSAVVALRDFARIRPDLVILDIKMPDMDGLQALRQIKALDRSVEVIMITAYASLETVKQALTHGAFEYLIKPFSRKELEDSVHRALTRRRSELGVRGQIAMLVNEMRALVAKTREMEETARREATEHALRVTQLSILREISRSMLRELDVAKMSFAVTELLRTALGYEAVTIIPANVPPPPGLVCAIRDADGLLGHLAVDLGAGARAIDPQEHGLLEMVAECLAIALRNAKLSEEAAEARRAVEQLFLTSPDAVIAVDPGERVASMNPAAQRLFGLAASEAVGKPITDLLPSDDYRRARSALGNANEAQAFDVTLAGRDERSLTLSIMLVPGSPLGTLGSALVIARDLSLQRTLEAQVVQSERLAALGQLAGGIAHDFNNQLQAILGYTQVIRRAPWDLEMVQKALHIVETAALGGSETVRRIQDFVRARTDEAVVPLDINQVINDAVAITRPRWEEQMTRTGVRLELILNLRAVLHVSGRPAALGEVITNLILNAIDAMPEGGTLTIETRQESEDRVVVTVRDTGVGMPDAVRQRVFEPFFTTKGQRGSGLGLSVSHSIITRHGGHISVDSEPGRGTTFTLVLPVATWATDAAPAPALPRSRRNARLLVVDDEPQVLSILSEMLERVGHTVTRATSGLEALELFAPGRYDVVLTDLGMGGMNGWQLVDRLRQIDRDVAMIFVTGWGLHEKELGRLRELGVGHCLLKPARASELDAAVQEALATRSAPSPA